jgi:hypothetical protein
VTDDDLREFAVAYVGDGVQLEHAAVGAFSGLTATYTKDGLFWQEWWLRSGHLMVYATHNVDHQHSAAEGDDVSRILSSLACTPANPS